MSPWAWTQPSLETDEQGCDPRLPPANHPTPPRRGSAVPASSSPFLSPLRLHSTNANFAQVPSKRPPCSRSRGQPRAPPHGLGFLASPCTAPSTAPPPPALPGLLVLPRSLMKVRFPRTGSLAPLGPPPELQLYTQLPTPPLAWPPDPQTSYVQT